MPHPHSFNYLQIIGDCFDGGDIWTTGLSLGSADGPVADPTLAGAQKAAELWNTFFVAETSRFDVKYRTTAVKLNKLGTDGRQVTDPTIEYVYPSPVVGTSNFGSMAPQCTLVASLRAERSRGLASKGRMYLPITGSDIGANGKIPAATVATIATNFQTFLNGLIAAIDVPGVPILTSGAGILGASATIQSIAVGDVYDTQRRRRNAFNETYTNRPIGDTA